MGTFFPKNVDKVVRKWFLIDATGLSVGRLGTVVADVLSGKNKPSWTPFMDMGDHVVVINAAKAVFTGSKESTKMYRRTTTQPGSMVEIRASVMRKTFPGRIIESAVRGMLSKGPLGRAMYKKLKVYDGAEHQQASQQPELMIIKK
jgi:large subunit ribosomal protein L13